LGAVVHETGGILISGGRLRLLGSGTVRSLLACNEATGGMRAPARLTTSLSFLETAG
jgi:hypothetical protein